LNVRFDCPPLTKSTEVTEGGDATADQVVAQSGDFHLRERHFCSSAVRLAALTTRLAIDQRCTSDGPS